MIKVWPENKFRSYSNRERFKDGNGVEFSGARLDAHRFYAIYYPSQSIVIYFSPKKRNKR